MVNENCRINMILKNKKFIEYCRKNDGHESNRKFCRHNIQHFFDVARVAYILNLELGLGFEKDIVYGAGLLHDIGRWQQYEKGIPHEEASAKLSAEILKDCGYSNHEADTIMSAVLTHRRELKEDGSLNYIICHADKKSRNCFFCSAASECRREKEKRNKEIIY